MASIRTFIAIETPSDIRAKIISLQRTLKQIDADVRWESEDTLHTTIKFLGDVNENILPTLVSLIEPIAQNQSPCTIIIEKSGCFPNTHQPRVIWVGCTNPDNKLTAIKKMIDTALQPHGFEIEQRAFTPHITLGRVKGTKNLSHLISSMEKLTFEPQQYTVHEVVLMKSVLRLEGSEYSVLKKFQLQL